jgi:nucleotide-binding universal stress UspA family protein
MNPFPSILVPLDGSRTAARSLGCAVWLAGRLGARLHLLSATESSLPTEEALARLHVPKGHWPLVTLHQAPGDPGRAILDAVTRYAVRLVVMTTRGEAAEAADEDPWKILGHVTRAVVEGSPVPVLVLPPAHRESLPWTSALVPVSGEAAPDAALATAVRMAAALDLAVHVVHVTDSEAGEEGLAARARYADEAHHEYPRLLEEFASRALCHCAPEERQRVESVRLCRGDVAEELRALIERVPISVLVVGWHGQFMAGHARVLKQLVRSVACPILLVKPAPPGPFRLKVGEEIERG